jgi:cytochrome c556
MKKTLLAGIALAMFGVSAAMAGVIEDRQTIMKGFGKANAALGGLAKAYDPQIEYAQLKVLSDGAANLAALFPAGSDQSSDPAVKTLALPAVWTDMPGFQAALAKFTVDVKNAQLTYDAASFTQAYAAVSADCGACHRTYRAPLPRPPAAAAP